MATTTAIHDPANISFAGVPLEQAKRVMVMVHGRGASAESILELAPLFMQGGGDIAFIAPQATGYTWYPHSFLAPIEHNEPYLSSALHVLITLVDTIIKQGIPCENIYLMGFSQGACLTLEFAVRFLQNRLPTGITNASRAGVSTQANSTQVNFTQANSIRFGGVIGLSGGVISPAGITQNDAEHRLGSFAGTPVFLGCSDRDPHIPKERFLETAELYRSLGATVDARLYPNMPHTIIDDEIRAIQTMLTW